MAQKITLKRSSVQGKIPATTDIDLGEIAINTYDGKVFIKKNDGTESIKEIGGELRKITETDAGGTSHTGYALADTDRSNKLPIGLNAIDFSESAGGVTAGASGNNSFALGVNAIVYNGSSACAIGETCKVFNNNSMAIGQNCYSSAWSGIATGSITYAVSGPTVAITAIDTTNNTLTVDNSSYFNIGDYISILNADSITDTTRFYFAEITAVDTSNNILTIGEVVGGDFTDITTSDTIYANKNGTKFVTGTRNVISDAVFEVGIGDVDNSLNPLYKNGLEVYYSGAVIAPELTTTVIDDALTSNKVLVTKEYTESKYLKNISRTVEELAGDGTTTSFTLTNTYTVGSETLVDVYVDGLLKVEGSGKDYTLSSGNTLDFTTAPSNGSVIIVKILG